MWTLLQGLDTLDSALGIKAAFVGDQCGIKTASARGLTCQPVPGKAGTSAGSCLSRFCR